MRARRKRVAPIKMIVAVAATATILTTGGILTDDGEAPVTESNVSISEAPYKAEAAKTDYHEITATKVEYYDVPLSYELQDVVFREAERWSVPPALILAMMDQESDYRTDVVSSTDDYGIMQINSINHPRLREELGITDFLDPEQSIACGAFMIGELLDKFDGDLHHALTAYNRGEGGASKYYRSNGTYETSYSTNILAIYESLEEGGDKGCR